MILALALATMPAPMQTAAFGGGARTCQAALEPVNYAASYAWLMGYFSGLNSGTGGTTGQTTNGDGIMAEIRTACQREPSRSLIDVAEDVYIHMREAGR